jgi:large subunit ribosomal protein L10
MDRTAKEAWVASLHRTLSETAVVVVAHYSGLTVAELGDLRAKMREAGVGLKVTKNRLARLALQGTPYSGLNGLFKGPTAIAFSNDPVAAAKVATGFAKTNAKLIILGGGLGDQPLDAEAVKALATLPSLDELRGRLIGLLNAPAQRIARILQAPASQLVGVTKAYAEKDEAA